MSAPFDWLGEASKGVPFSTGLVERRVNLTVASTPYLCAEMEIPAAYVAALIEEAQAAMKAVKGGRAALIRIVIEIAPFSVLLGSEAGQ